MAPVGTDPALGSSCAWDSSPLHPRGFGGQGPTMWHFRWRVVLRAGRLGYNVLSLDSDMVGDVGIAREGVAGEDQLAEEGTGDQRGRRQLERRPQQKLGTRKPARGNK